MLKSAASTPAEMVMVADSETRIVAAVVDGEMFSAAENEADEVKDGAVVSASAELDVVAFIDVNPVLEVD